MIIGGDTILGENSSRYFNGVDEVLFSADIRYTHLEVPYSDDAVEFADLNRELENLEPLAGRFEIVSMAGNHIFDAGEKPIKETIDWLDKQGILHVGCGMNIQDAIKPAVLDKNGVRFGFLNYNCTGPMQTYAEENKAGCAFVKIITKYELGDVANPGGPPAIIKTFADEKSFEQMKNNIRELRKHCDVLSVYLHKGLVHKPVKLADYEQLVSYAAIDEGADVVFGCHSHILHGIEVYKGKTIYHGLNNFIAWVPSLSPDFKAKKGKANDLFDPEEWARTRAEKFGFIPDPEYPTYPFHPDSIYTIIAKCYIEGKRIVRTGFIPAIVNKEGIPIVVGRENGGQEVLDYMISITEGANINGEFCWDGDEITIQHPGLSEA